MDACEATRRALQHPTYPTRDHGVRIRCTHRPKPALTLPTRRWQCRPHMTSPAQPVANTSTGPVVPVLLVGPQGGVRRHVFDVLRHMFAVTEVDRVEDARALILQHMKTEKVPPAVSVVMCGSLAQGLAQLAVLRPHSLETDGPVLLMVDAPDPVKGLEGLPEDVIRGRWERADLLLRVQNLCRLASARMELAAARTAVAEQRLASEKLRRALETERVALNSMARYLSPVVLTHIQDGRAFLPPTRQDLAVLFSDIRGFTDASGFSTPEELVELLGEYLSEVNSIITQHGGNLDKFMGDGILAYFMPSPNESAPHPARAVAAALRVLHRLEELKVNWFERGFLPVGVGVGISTGQAIMGTIGVGERLDHTVIGPTVNLAARLQALARGGEIVVDQPTRAACGRGLRTRDSRQAMVKGFEAAVLVHVVTGMDGVGQTEP